MKQERTWCAALAALLQREEQHAGWFLPEVSLASLHEAPMSSRPQAVCVGLGLCGRKRLSEALPLDVLGMILAAEVLRREVGASRLIILVADAHARSNFFADADVDVSAQNVERVLLRLRARLGLAAMRIVRASSFHSTSEYRTLLRRAGAQLNPTAHGYVRRQVADMLFFEEAFGPFVKVGWARAVRREGLFDETYFDELARPILRTGATFVYGRPGCVLSQQGQQPAPYIALNSAQRLCLRPYEDVFGKLRGARARLDPARMSECLDYFQRIIALWDRFETAPQGAWIADRLQCIIDDVCFGSNCHVDYETGRVSL